jgi:hypothetical protein
MRVNCSCDVCKIPLEARYNVAYGDSLCAFCAERCYPLCSTGTRICMARESREKLHRDAAPLGASSRNSGASPAQQFSGVAERMATELGRTVERAVREEGIPLLQRAAREAAEQFLSRSLKAVFGQNAKIGR